MERSRCVTEQTYRLRQICVSFSILQPVEQPTFLEKVLEVNDLAEKLSFFATKEAISGVNAGVVDDGACRDIGREPEAADDGVALPGVLDGLLNSINNSLNGLLTTLCLLEAVDLVTEGGVFDPELFRARLKLLI